MSYVKGKHSIIKQMKQEASQNNDQQCIKQCIRADQTSQSVR